MEPDCPLLSKIAASSALMFRFPDMTKSPLLFATAVLACFIASPAAQAVGDDNLPAAVNRVERETGGRVLSAERRNQSGREVNRIKVYTPEGRVRVMWEGTQPAQGPAARTPVPDAKAQDRRALRAREAREAPIPRDRR